MPRAITPVGQDRQILPRSGSGDPELQRRDTPPFGPRGDLGALPLPDAIRYWPALQGGINTEMEL